MSTGRAFLEHDGDRFNAMLTAASKAYDERLSAILRKSNGLPGNTATEAFGEECENMMRESLPPVDTPTTTEDGQRRAITISCGLG